MASAAAGFGSGSGAGSGNDKEKNNEDRKRYVDYVSSECFKIIAAAYFENRPNALSHTIIHWYQGLDEAGREALQTDMPGAEEFIIGWINRLRHTENHK